MSTLRLDMPSIILGACFGLGLIAAPTAAAPISLPYTGAPACTASVAQHPDDGALHAVNCSQVAYASNPPSSGTHYGSWAAFKTYSARVPAGFLVHSLEHGSIVIGYNCPGGCEDEVAQVQAWINSLPTDPLCLGEKHKIILAPNSALDMRWGAAAWTWTWKAPCMDTVSLAQFFRAHYGKTVEAGVCGGGSDLSSIGWCPDAIQRPPRRISQDNFHGTQGPRTLWTGRLEKRTRIFVEAALPDGSVVERLELGEAGPGPAQALWDAAGFRKRHPSAVAVILRVRTSAGEELAVQSPTLSR